MRVYLVGFMGSGKSTVGKKLAKQLEYNVIDLDRYIEAKLFKTIPEIFKEKGEESFRVLETKYLSEIAQFENVVISTGGGTPCFNKNLEIMRDSGTVIYLELEQKALVSRLANSKRKDRPMLDNIGTLELNNFVENKMKERVQFYEKAHIKLNAMSIDIKLLAEKIKALK
jgi:shikimate kinase